MSETPRIVVCHPNVQHSHFTAVGVQRMKALEQYLSQFYYAPERFPQTLIRYLPASLRRRLESFMYSRRHTELDINKVKLLNTWAELFFIALNRLRFPRSLVQGWLRYANKRFAKEAGRFAASHADMVISTDTNSRDVFAAAGASVIKVLDMTNAHVLTAHRIWDEERKLVPEFAETIDIAIREESDIAYCVEEAELADYYLCGSSYPKETLLEQGIAAERIFVVPYGVDIELFKPPVERKAHDGLRLLFVGRVGQRKGISYLLQAIRELRQDYPDISLTIGGNIALAAEVLEPYKDCFEYIGMRPHQTMPQIYAEADIFVFPSLFEGFPRVSMEALACGLPLITTPNTGAQDVVEDGVQGFIVPLRDVDALKKRILQLYHDRALLDKMRIAARVAAEKLTWEDYYRNLADALWTIWRKERA